MVRAAEPLCCHILNSILTAIRSGKRARQTLLSADKKSEPFWGPDLEGTIFLAFTGGENALKKANQVGRDSKRVSVFVAVPLNRLKFSSSSSDKIHSGSSNVGESLLSIMNITLMARRTNLGENWNTKLQNIQVKNTTQR